MFGLLPPPAPAPCHEDWDAPDPPVLGRISLEEHEKDVDQTTPESISLDEPEEDVVQTPPETFSLEEPENDGQAPTPHEEELVGALEPWDPWTVR